MITPPGVMLYLELYPLLDYLTMDERGHLLSAILAYARDAQTPDFTSPTLAAVWTLVMPRIDRDKAAYVKKVKDAKYAAYSRECKRSGAHRLAKNEWLELYASDDV